jgi:transcription antitermination factor NusG
VVQVPGVSCLIGFNGQPAPVDAEQIEGLQQGLASGLRAVPHPYLTQGRRVRIKAGPLKDLEGILLRRKGNLRVVLSVELLQRSIVVDADLLDLEPLSVAAKTRCRSESPQEKEE